VRLVAFAEEAGSADDHNLGVFEHGLSVWRMIGLDYVNLARPVDCGFI
jgi:hypothetical protein